MARFVGFGIEEYIAQLDHLLIENTHICKEAVYDGAKIVADAIKANIQSFPVEEVDWQGQYQAGENRHQTAINATQKAGLIEGFGIAKMEESGGEINTHVGFHGYNKVHTTKYPHGQPNAMIARSVEGGTSFRQKHPFVAPAVRKARSSAETKMKETIEKRITEIMK